MNYVLFWLLIHHKRMRSIFSSLHLLQRAIVSLLSEGLCLPWASGESTGLAFQSLIQWSGLILVANNRILLKVAYAKAEHILLFPVTGKLGVK